MRSGTAARRRPRRPPLVSVLLVSFNGAAFLPGCLSSLNEQGFRDFELVFVDNGSSDGSWKLARRHFPSCTLLRLRKNAGYIGGNNRGYRLCRGKHVLLVNDDIVFQRESIAELVRAMESDGRIALAGSVQVSPSGRGPEYVSTISVLGFEAPQAPEGRVADSLASTSCCLVRRSAFPGRRIFDPMYGVFIGEGLCLNLTAMYAGLRAVDVLSSRVFHLGMDRPFTGMRARSTERSALINYARFYSPRTAALLLPVLACEWLLKTCAELVTLRFWEAAARLRGDASFLSDIPAVLAARRRSLAGKRLGDAAVLSGFAARRVFLRTPADLRYAFYREYVRLLLLLRLL